MTSKLSYFAFLVSLIMILLSSCQDTDSICVELKFHPVENIPDSSWVKIDEHTFLHTPHDFEWRANKFFPNEDGNGDFCYVPATRNFFYHPNNNEKRVMEKMTNFEVGKRLAIKLTSIEKDSVKVYQIVNPTEYLVNGIIKIQRTDKKKISFSHSEDNPVYLSYKRLE